METMKVQIVVENLDYCMAILGEVNFKYAIGELEDAILKDVTSFEEEGTQVVHLLYWVDYEEPEYGGMCGWKVKQFTDNGNSTIMLCSVEFVGTAK
jgi:hypothetical protein